MEVTRELAHLPEQSFSEESVLIDAEQSAEDESPDKRSVVIKADNLDASRHGAHVWRPRHLQEQWADDGV